MVGNPIDASVEQSEEASALLLQHGTYWNECPSRRSALHAPTQFAVGSAIQHVHRVRVTPFGAFGVQWRYSADLTQSGALRVSLLRMRNHLNT